MKNNRANNGQEAAAAARTETAHLPKRHAQTLGRKQWRRFGLAVVLLVSLAMRIPWRNADVGNEGFWTYGYFVTDEGYYTSGGRLSVLNGHCLDPEMNEPPTFGAAPAMHYLSALSYRIRGITYDACRWPTMLACSAGWGGAFWLTASVTHPLIALAITLPISLNPLSLTYERASSSDATVGAFLLLALCLLRSRHRFAFLAGGMFFSLAPAIKATGIAFVPLILLTTLTMSYRRWTRIGWGLLGYLFGWGILHGINDWILLSHPSHTDPEMLRGDCSAAAGASLPLPTREQAIHAIPIFPRYPVDTKLGIFIAWCLALPAWGAISHLARGWNRRLQRPALYLGMLVFAMAMSIQTASTERYFLPLIMLTPWILANARASIFRWTRGKTMLRGITLMLVCLAIIGFFWWGSPATAGHNPGEVLTNEYNLPPVCAWVILWIPLLLTMLLLVAATAPWARNWQGVVCTIPAALVSAHLLWHAWPMARLGGAFSAAARPSFLVQQLLVIGVLFLFAVPGRHCRWRMWYGALGTMFVLSFYGIASWRTSIPIWWQRGETVRQAALELEKHLPKNSIVLGNRASSLLRGSHLRLGLCTPNYTAQNFVDKLTCLMNKYPNRPFFLLIDSDHSYHGSYLQKAGAGKIDMKAVGTLPLPAAGGKGQTIRVFVVQLFLKR